jgi:hypothetical protein
MLADPTYNSFSHQHFSYVTRGIYAPQLRRLFELYPREQIHITNSNDFYKDPSGPMADVVEFLGLKPWQLETFKQYNTYRKTPVSDAIRSGLDRFFRPHNEELYDLVGRDFGWGR